MSLTASENCIKVFICYSHADGDLRNQLEQHLSALIHSGAITIWQDQKILPGTNWENQINTNLNEADLILLLVSASFIASNYCWNREMQKAMERDKERTSRVVPIVLRPVDFQNTPLKQLQTLPTSLKPITSWSDQDEAFEDVARGVRSVVEDLRLIRQGQQQERELSKQQELGKGEQHFSVGAPPQMPPPKQASLAQIKKPRLKLSSERRKIGRYDEAPKYPYPFKKPLLILGIVLVVLLSITLSAILLAPRIFPTSTLTSTLTPTSTPVPLWHGWPAVRSDAFQDQDWLTVSTGDYPWCRFASPSSLYEEQTQGHNYCNYGESAHHHWTDVALSMQINIKQGEWGGSIIRLQQGAYYDFRITTFGSYELIRHLPDNGGQDYTMTSGTSSAIHRGYDVWNTLTIGVKGTTFQLWVNDQYLTTATDNTIQWGTIGVSASYGQQSDARLTLVQFRHAQVWLSPEEPYSI